jgi:hypothetical protein
MTLPSFASDNPKAAPSLCNGWARDVSAKAFPLFTQTGFAGNTRM